MNHIENIVKIMQASVAPCVLISGFGFLLLTMTNRLGRATDRARTLHTEFKTASPKDQKELGEQIVIFYKRCLILQKAIALLTVSIFFIIVDVLLLFMTFIAEINLQLMIEAFFIGSLLCLIASLASFFIDIRMTLQSLKIELKEYLT